MALTRRISGVRLRSELSRAGRRLPLVGRHQAYIWIAPTLVVAGFVLLYPSLKVVLYSFTDRTTLFPGSAFVGFHNYHGLLTTPLFWKALTNNFILLLSIPVSIGLALVITAVLYRRIHGSHIYEVLIFIPFLPSVASIGVVFIYVLSWQGPLNAVLRGTGGDAFARSWLTEPSWAIWSILAVVVWQRVGFTVLLFTARLVAVDRELFEAAAVDGASWRVTFWRVAIPQMRSIIMFAAVLGFIEVFSWTFAYVFVLTRGGPYENTFTLEYLLYQYLFQDQNVGLASTVAVLLLMTAVSVAVYRVRVARREGAV